MKTISRVTVTTRRFWRGAAAYTLRAAAAARRRPRINHRHEPKPRAQSVSSAVAVHDASCQGQRTFHYTGRAENFRVPMCATSIYIDANGAAGECGGDGGEVSATIPVTSGETLIVRVGGAGSGWHGGFNGGGAGQKIRKGERTGVLVAVAAAQVMSARAATRWRTASWWRAEAAARRDKAHATCTGGTGGGLPDGGSGGTPACGRGLPSAVAAVRSLREALEEREATAARWATAAPARRLHPFIHWRAFLSIFEQRRWRRLLRRRRGW